MSHTVGTTTVLASTASGPAIVVGTPAGTSGLTSTTTTPSMVGLPTPSTTSSSSSSGVLPQGTSGSLSLGPSHDSSSSVSSPISRSSLLIPAVPKPQLPTSLSGIVTGSFPGIRKWLHEIRNELAGKTTLHDRMAAFSRMEVKDVDQILRMEIE
jgi:hypothetical protein